MSPIMYGTDPVSQMDELQAECAEDGAFDAQVATIIKECPICGGGLQATREEDLGSVFINGRGEMVSFQAEGEGDLRIYCENDHDLSEMLKAHHEDQLI